MIVGLPAGLVLQRETIDRDLARRQQIEGYHRGTFAHLIGMDFCEISGYESETEDEALLNRLSELAAIADPVPGSVEADARAAFRWRRRSLTPALFAAARVQAVGDRGLAAIGPDQN